MAKKFRNFKCAETGEVFERMTKDSELIVECKCKGLANRTLSAPKCFQNTTGRSPSSR